MLMLVLLVWMCYALLEYGNTRFDRLLGNEDPWWGKSLVTGGGALTDWITPSLIVALAIFVVGLFGIRWWLNRPDYADLLIETEAELRRVTWAPLKEVNRATSVVLYFVFWFVLIMFCFDLTFSMGIGMLQGRKWNEAGWGRVATMVVPWLNEDKAEAVDEGE